MPSCLLAVGQDAQRKHLRFAMESQNKGMEFGYKSFGGDLPGAGGNSATNGND